MAVLVDKYSSFTIARCGSIVWCVVVAVAVRVCDIACLLREFNRAIKDKSAPSVAVVVLAAYRLLGEFAVLQVGAVCVRAVQK
jgi:hypothetical protein